MNRSRSVPVLACGLALASAGRLSAQVALGDSAWAAGNFPLARTAYERVLTQNPGFARANYRIGILLSWDGQLDSALVMVGRARAAVPQEPAYSNTAAQILSWAGRLPAALALYDSVLAEHPDNRAALLGRARTLTWSDKLAAADSTYDVLIAQDSTDLPVRNAQAAVSAARGDYGLAVARYEASLARQPGNVEARTGLAQTRLWMGQPLEARRQIEQAWAVDTTYPAARSLRSSIAQTLRSRLELALGWSYDSDKNTSWWQTAGVNGPIGESLRGVATVGLLEASDPSGTGTRLLAEAGGVWNRGSTSATMTLGLRNLAPAGAATHTEGSGRVGVRHRLNPRATIGGALFWEPFDATVTLLRQPVSQVGADVDADLTLAPHLTLGTGGGAAWTDDGNRRWSAVAVLMRQAGSQFSFGGAGRVLSYRQKGVGYFSPELYWFLEGRGVWDRLFSGVWEARVAAGLGVQQIESGSRLQSQFHAEGRLARRLAAVNEVALSAGLSNSAASSTTGAYRYYTVQLSARIGL